MLNSHLFQPEFEMSIDGQILRQLLDAISESMPSASIMMPLDQDIIPFVNHRFPKGKVREILSVSVNLQRAQLILYIAHFSALHALGRDWLPTLSFIAGQTFMNEFAPYTMVALPLQQFHEMHSSNVYSKTAVCDLRSHAEYFPLPWKIPEEISRRSMLSHI